MKIIFIILWILILLLLAVIFVILLAVIFVILMHINCVEVDPDYTLYDDEINMESIEKFKLKNK